MAEKLHFFDFSPFRPTGRPAKYPWHDWSDGSIWRITRGVDYDVPTRSMQATLFAYAGRQRLSVRTRQVTLEGREALVFRFSPRVAVDGGGVFDVSGGS